MNPRVFPIVAGALALVFFGAGWLVAFSMGSESDDGPIDLKSSPATNPITIRNGGFRPTVDVPPLHIEVVTYENSTVDAEPSDLDSTYIPPTYAGPAPVPDPTPTPDPGGGYSIGPGPE